ncbi:hypothetical protein AGMMS50267_14940 [Spirochaetia bacterium]|nr:hypothetical protein AGMMS50267_14940 [Spirochaetia bacterium]
MAAAVLVLIVISSLAILFIGWRNKLGNERKELQQLWAEGAWEQVFLISRDRLADKPMDFFLLTLNGFSAFQMAIAQINDSDTKTYIDACIWSLRKALQCKEALGDPRILYVLGKAYYHTGKHSAGDIFNEELSGYEDLAVQFLEAAWDGYQASGMHVPGDLPEYLGLAYAAIHDYRKSVEAFSLALSAVSPGVGGEDKSGSSDPDPSPGVTAPADLLLLVMAQSYIALGDQPSADTARAYLVQCVETSTDSRTKIRARFLLGELFEKSGDVSQAEAQYLTILEENGENAEAHFQLGELYAAGGDSIRARAEWRKTVRIDPAHRGARQRLNM